MTYYNEHDPDAVAVLRQLIAEGLIPAGEVDERSITEVKPHEIADYTQHHFFAGFGGWPLALRMAVWSDERPVRTGSCPCQPFSGAGLQKGTADERHLWPQFRDLITFGKPTVTFGEQVASKLGREWLSGIRADLEGLGYAVGAADLCAAGVGAPHIRQRLYWVADSAMRAGQPGQSRAIVGAVSGCDGEGLSSRLADSNGAKRWPCDQRGTSHDGQKGEWNEGANRLRECRPARGMGNTPSDDEQRNRFSGPVGGRLESRGGSGPWSDSRWIECRDGKHRRIPTKPALFPLADGLSYRVARRRSVRAPLLKGAGNAIVPQVAAEFIKAFMSL